MVDCWYQAAVAHLLRSGSTPALRVGEIYEATHVDRINRDLCFVERLHGALVECGEISAGNCRRSREREGEASGCPDQRFAAGDAVKRVGNAEKGIERRFDGVLLLELRVESVAALNEGLHGGGGVGIRRNCGIEGVGKISRRCIGCGVLGDSLHRRQFAGRFLQNLSELRGITSESLYDFESAARHQHERHHLARLDAVGKILDQFVAAVGLIEKRGVYSIERDNGDAVRLIRGQNQVLKNAGLGHDRSYLRVRGYDFFKDRHFLFLAALENVEAIFGESAYVIAALVGHNHRNLDEDGFGAELEFAFLIRGGKVVE